MQKKTGIGKGFAMEMMTINQETCNMDGICAAVCPAGIIEMTDNEYPVMMDNADEICIKCGVCTYLCPTCSCFDIQDEVRGDCGFRCRNWDTCMFGLTTQHASGHNPRPMGKERFRQRFMHKLKYFQDDFDVIMCVGCGRCVQSCPVNIDIREIVKALSA